MLTWFLDRWGVESSLAQDLVVEAIGGRFESWTHPDPALVDDVAERLTGSIPRAADARESTVQPDDLQRWLEVRDQVPWKPARSRSGAEGGRERYGIGPETQDQFNACLAQSEFDPNHPLSVSVRAACVYLDVCFFHPFDDGNARSAFLAALFVLAREGIVLENLGTLRWFSFYATDPEDARGWPVTSKEAPS